jgi:hypothetical protein
MEQLIQRRMETMSREILSFTGFFVLLVLAFYFGGGHWRGHQQAYRQAALQGSQHDWINGSVGNRKTPPADSLLEILEEAGLSTRLERLADSLAAVRADLSEVRNLLLAARDALSGMEAREADEGDGQYFSAVRSFRRTENSAGTIGNELDSLRAGVAALKQLSHKQSGNQPAKIRWLDPSRVPVREACTTCHLPLNGEGTVMLYPDSKDETIYPATMAAHDYRQFGCTVCHVGSPVAVDFITAHGPDKLLRPFRPGKLALRSCGYCHADRSPLADGRVAFSWPEDCSGCHQQDSLFTLADSSDNKAFKVPIRESELRNWLLRHWAENSGEVPSRDQFEAALSMLVSGDIRRQAKSEQGAVEVPAADGNDSITDGTCPRCGRTYRLSLEVGEVFCPADGARLVTGRERQ